MRPERAYTFCRFPKVSAALWRVCRHIIGRLAIRDYIYQVSARCPLSKVVRNLQLQAFFHVIQRREETSTNDISSKRYVKNTLRIDSKQRLPCFSRYYGVNLEKSLAFWWHVLVAKRDAPNGPISLAQKIFQEKLNVCYLTESPHWKHPKFFRGKWFIDCFCENVAC